MKYLSLKSIEDAYRGCNGITQNKFWGLLAILKAINCRIVPGKGYPFSSIAVSDILDDIFSFNYQKNERRKDDVWSALFSSKWLEVIPEIMFSNDKKPNLLDVAIWFFRNYQFPDEYNSKDLIALFLDTFYLKKEEVEDIFDLRMKDVDFSDSQCNQNELLSKLLGYNSSKSNISIHFEGGYYQYPAGALTKAGFVQTLYSAHTPQKCLILTQFDFNEEYRGKKEIMNTNDFPLQKIYFGTPGSGKSWTIKKEYEMSLVNGEYIEDNEKKQRVFRTTFHPDTDYSSFVGCYKPIMEEGEIKYKFVPQVFLEAYINAWNNIGDEKQYYLVIEEINRGNCAQIFGDLFQLLDRNCNTGYSEYPIKADMDLRDFLENNEGKLKLTNKQGIENGELRLPPNLNIIASMNTSDQSLFPMDSAFKRRWSWEYVPIQYDEPHSSSFKINISGSPFDKWVDFLVKVNKIILEKTDSEDKQMGNFFIKGDVNENVFKDKVMFYLWSEICKDLYQTNDNFFRADLGGDAPVEFSFNMLYEKNADNFLLGFLKYIDQYKLKGE